MRALVHARSCLQWRIAAWKALDTNRAVRARASHPQPEEVEEVSRQYGQPTNQTHPWDLKAGEVAPGITFAELASRRANLCEALPDHSLTLVPSAPLRYMTGVIPYPYRQDADFYYLTGLTQEGLAMFHKRIGQDMTYTLFTKATAADRTIWEGQGLSPREAVDTFGADASEPLTAHALARRATAVASDVRMLFCDGGQECRELKLALPDIVKELANNGSPNIAAALRAGPRGRPRLQPGSPAAAAAVAAPLRPLKPLMHHLRWRKSPAEVALLAASADASARAIAACAAHSHPGTSERDIDALFRFRCATAGAQGLSFPPVAAAGAHACTIHYGRNDSRAGAGDLVLLDAGCERWGYASDVTRTWPVSGRYSPAQRAVYEIVLSAHRACIAEVRPGARLREIHDLSVALLIEGLEDLGVAAGAGGWSGANGYRRFYPHAVGHWLGLDTHDCASVPHDTPLEEGVTLTIEPGLYLQGEGVPQELRGIGVRIEDDVAVTEDGCAVLSGAAPVDTAAVEELAGSAAAHWAALCGA